MTPTATGTGMTHQRHRAPLHRLRATGDPSPQLLMRVLELFAQQALLPVNAMLARRGDELEIVLDQDGLDPRQADICLQKVRAMVGIRCARLDLILPELTQGPFKLAFSSVLCAFARYNNVGILSVKRP